MFTQIAAFWGPEEPSGLYLPAPKVCCFEAACWDAAPNQFLEAAISGCAWGRSTDRSFEKGVRHFWPSLNPETPWPNLDSCGTHWVVWASLPRGDLLRRGAITCDSGNSCDPLPASLSHRPTPHKPLLKTIVKPQFDRAVDRAVEAFFLVFQDFNQAQFQPCFRVFTVRSAEGRKSRNASLNDER